MQNNSSFGKTLNALIIELFDAELTAECAGLSCLDDSIQILAWLDLQKEPHPGVSKIRMGLEEEEQDI